MELINNIKSTVELINNNKNKLNRKKKLVFLSYAKHTLNTSFFSILRKYLKKKKKNTQLRPLQEYLEELHIEIFLRERSNSVHLPLCKAHGWENDTFR